MIHPNTELKFIDKNVGYGVFATAFIPKGTIVYVKDQMEIVVSPDMFMAYGKELREVVDKYSYIDENGDRIVSWDFAKYVNHCCNCNTISTAYGFEFALRDIQAGDQITDEYGLFNLEYEMNVECGQDCCRKKIFPNDLEKHHAEWDAKIKASIPFIKKVEQPIWNFLDNDIMQELEALNLDISRYKSIRTLKNKLATT